MGIPTLLQMGHTLPQFLTDKHAEYLTSRDLQVLRNAMLENGSGRLPAIKCKPTFVRYWPGKADIAAVSAQLGHVGISPTVHNYAHVTAGSPQRAAELMPQIDLVQFGADFEN